MKIHDSSFSTDFSERHKMIMSGWMLAPLMGRSKRCVDQGKHGHGGFRFAIGPAPSHHPIIHPATGTLGVPPWRRGNQVDPVNVFVGFPPQKIATRTSCCASSFWSMAKWNSRPGAMQLWLGRFPDSLDQNFEPRLVSGCLPQAEDVFFDYQLIPKMLEFHEKNVWIWGWNRKKCNWYSMGPNFLCWILTRWAFNLDPYLFCCANFPGELDGILNFAP